MADVTSSKVPKKQTTTKLRSSTSVPSKATAKKAPTKKPAARRVATKTIAKTPKAAVKAAKHSAPNVTARKPRGYRKIKIVGIEAILQKKAELVAVTTKAKKQLQKEYTKAIANVEAIKAHYKDLFDEPIEAKGKRAPKKAGTARGIGIAAPITKAEVASFIEQKEQGISISDIKIKGRRSKSIQKIAAAYSQADKRDTSSVLALLK